MKSITLEEVRAKPDSEMSHYWGCRSCQKIKIKIKGLMIEKETEPMLTSLGEGRGWHRGFNRCQVGLGRAFPSITNWCSWTTAVFSPFMTCTHILENLNNPCNPNNHLCALPPREPLLTFCHAPVSYFFMKLPVWELHSGIWTSTTLPFSCFYIVIFFFLFLCRKYVYILYIFL